MVMQLENGRMNVPVIENVKEDGSKSYSATCLVSYTMDFTKEEIEKFGEDEPKMVEDEIRRMISTMGTEITEISKAFIKGDVDINLGVNNVPTKG